MQAKACFLKHELTRINHELTINGWRGVIFLRVIVLRIENPYNILRQIANLPQQGTRGQSPRSAVTRQPINQRLDRDATQNE